MAAKGEMVYAWTTDADLQSKAECGGAVTALLKYALESKAVDAVLAVQKGTDIYDAQPTLITDPKDLDKTAGSLHCGTLLLPKLIKKYLDGAKDMKVAVTVKGCDMMAMYELAKRGQINLDNVIMIGVNCGGSVSPTVAAQDDRREVRARPRRRGQGGDRQGPVHRHDEGRDPQGHLHRRTRGGGLRPPHELPPVPAQGPAPGRHRGRQLGRHRRQGRQGDLRRGLLPEGRGPPHEGGRGRRDRDRAREPEGDRDPRQDRGRDAQAREQVARQGLRRARRGRRAPQEDPRRRRAAASSATRASRPARSATAWTARPRTRRWSSPARFRPASCST